MKKKVVIIGSGFSSLSASCYLAKNGFEVSVFEKIITLEVKLVNLKKTALPLLMVR